jgi:predicted ester cyclase
MARREGGLRRRRRVSAEENKAIFRRYVEEVTNLGKLEIADEIFDHYLAHQPDGSVLQRGPQDVKRFQSEFRSAFPDIHATIEDQVAEGDKVVSRWRIRGTHEGEFRGTAPTGEEIEINGIGIFRFSPEGKVVESWDSYDQLGIIRQAFEQELGVARRIQQALLPQSIPQPDGWELTACYQPARVSRRRLLRLPRTRRRSPWAGHRGRHRPWRTGSAGDGQHPKRPSRRRPKRGFCT